MGEVYKFDSGLTLLYEKNTINTITNLAVSFECGTRCNGHLPGLAHFCEHMFFTGTDKMSRQEVEDKYYGFSNTNAYTSQNRVWFSGEIFTEELEDYLSTVQDLICNSTFSPEEVKEQQKVISQEIAQVEGDYFWIYQFFETYELYRQECMKYDNLGTVETINKITSDDVKKFVNKYFVNNNCTIKICTPLSFERVKEVVRTNFESLMPSNSLKPPVNDRDKLDENEMISMRYENIDKNFFDFVLKINVGDTKYRDSRLFHFVREVLNEELTKELRVNKSLVYYIRVKCISDKIGSCIKIQTEISKEQIRQCIDAITEVINTIYQKGFDENIFNKVMRYNKYYNESKVNTPEYIVDDLSEYLYYGKFLTQEEMNEIDNSITLEELNELIREWLDIAKIQLIIYGDAGKDYVYTIDEIKEKINFNSVKCVGGQQL